MKHRIHPTATILHGLAVVAALALTAPVATAASTTELKPKMSPTDPQTWFTFLEDKPGMLYQDKENPLLQEFQLMGRFQYQLGYVDGEGVNGNDVSETHDEYRRVRLGAQGKFLQYFGFKYQVNLVNDKRNKATVGDLDWGYDSIDEAYLSFDLGKAMDITAFDKLRLSYGRQKFVFSQEAHTSSTKLLTVERSALANKVYDSGRPTGLKIDAATGDWSFIAALYSSTEDGKDNQEFNGWQDDEIYYTYISKQVDDALKVGLDLTYNDADAVHEDSILAYRWATSLHAVYDFDSWSVIGDLIYGDNGDSNMQSKVSQEGNFWGFVVMPYTWLVEDQLQLVGQYQYAAAEEAEGIRINSRYGRADGTGGAPLADVNKGRGDRHHSFYTGLNYYLAGHNAKIQAGVEYQTMDTPKGDFDTTTFLLAFRSFF